jgi:hypothetical protein
MNVCDCSLLYNSLFLYATLVERGKHKNNENNIFSMPEFSILSFYLLWLHRKTRMLLLSDEFLMKQHRNKSNYDRCARKVGWLDRNSKSVCLCFDTKIIFLLRVGFVSVLLLNFVFYFTSLSYRNNKKNKNHFNFQRKNDICL